MKKETPPIVLSLGGSLVVPAAGIDTEFLKNFRHAIMPFVEAGQRFIIVVGGGITARMYMNAAKAVAPLEEEDMDWLGIHSTRINGHLLRAIFRHESYPVVIKNPSRPTPRWTEPLLIAAGWRPGRSTDYIAVRLARRHHAQTIINLSNIERVYSKDPNKHADAVPFDEISWKEFRNIVGTKWQPGSSAPFDPIASTWAHRWNMKVIVARGSDFHNLKNILQDKKFIGTTIA
jgi:uridylate kinase